MLSLGAPLADALRIAGKASRSFFYESAAIELSQQIDQASAVPPNLSSRVLPPTLLYALQAASGGVPSLPMLQSLAQSYSERAQSRLDLVTTMMPIVAVVTVGLGVGFVIIALFMPLVSMITSLA
jgi:type IV pilus assembly protein PilC